MIKVQHYLAFYRAADSELTLGEIGRYRHQYQGVGYIYKVGLQTGKKRSAYGNTKLMFFYGSLHGKRELHRLLYKNEKEINLSF